jgi:hypothetical protein
LVDAAAAVTVAGFTLACGGSVGHDAERVEAMGGSGTTTGGTIASGGGAAAGGLDTGSGGSTVGGPLCETAGTSTCYLQVAVVKFGEACGLLTDGGIGCWNYLDQGRTPLSGEFVQLTSGAYHVCGLRTDGTVACACWDTGYGEAPPETCSAPSDAFIQIAAGPPFDETYGFFSGGAHTCGVRADGTIACWGDNSYGQLTPPSGSFLQVTAGGAHSCGLRTDGTVVCWGEARPYSSLTGPPAPPAGTFRQISAGSTYDCGVQTDESIACWTLSDVTYKGGSFLQVSAGYNHSCGLRTDGTVACWGDDTDGQSTPPSGTFVQVAAGLYTSCGVRTDGRVICWGNKDYEFP